MIHLCNTCGCKGAESFDTESLDDFDEVLDSYDSLYDFIKEFSEMGNDYVSDKGAEYIKNHLTIYHAESFDAESKFDKLANKIAAQYREKGKSAKEAMKIGKATAYKIGARKYGKAGMARKARAGMRAEGFEGESPMMKNITAIGVLALAILAGKKLTR